MILHELTNNIAYRSALVATVADNTAQNSAIIDTQGYEHVTFVITTGTLTTGAATFAVSMTHGDDPALADGAAVGSDVLVGSLAGAGFTGADDNSTRKIGYTPGKGAGRRYVRLTVTPAGNAAAASFAVTAALLPLYRPAA